MRFAILYSKKDEAGVNIAEQLKNHFLPHIPILELGKETIFCEGIDEKLDELKNIDFIIFATKHQSKQGTKSLSLHAPGNWRNADFGGKPSKICKTSSLVLKFLFEKMSEHKNQERLEDYELTMECTHHGPLIEKPCLFIEIGSNEEGWKNQTAGKIIAKTLNDLQNFDEWKQKQENQGKNKIKSAIAIGGPHYCPNFNKIQLSNKSQIAISHVIPEYQFPISESMLKEALEKTQEHTNTILLDWKGSGNSESRQKILDLCNKLGLEFIRTDQVEK
jgi:D-aminoacyl-tRNA deacylase